jgi:hypothetical protein
MLHQVATGGLRDYAPSRFATYQGSEPAATGGTRTMSSADRGERDRACEYKPSGNS